MSSAAPPPPNDAVPTVWRTGSALFAGQALAGGLGALAWLIAARTHPAGAVGTAIALVGALTWAGLVGNLGLGSLVVGILPGVRRSDRAGIAGVAVATVTVVGGALASVRHLRGPAGDALRRSHQARAAKLKALLHAAGLPALPSPSHIVPVLVGDPVRCKEASDQLLGRYGIYIQPINYPTVPRGTERLRITPAPCHDDGLMADLLTALREVWARLRLPDITGAAKLLAVG